MEQAQPLRPDENSMLSFDLDPEQWLDDPDDDEEAAAVTAAPPTVRHFADIGRLPAPDAAVLLRRTVTQAAATGNREGDTKKGGTLPATVVYLSFCSVVLPDLVAHRCSNPRHT